MSSSFRIGSVSYLNAKPLIEGIPSESLLLLPPRMLADEFEKGDLDAALLPTYYLLNHPDLRAIRGIGIGCEGTVLSVFIHPQEGKSIPFRTMTPSLESMTSNHLAEIILRKYHQNTFQWVEHSGEGEVIIGDKAFQFKAQHPTAPILDLGDAWWEATGLPFVFALWVIHPRVQDEKLAALSALIKNAWANGKSKIKSFAKTPMEYQYLVHYLHYDLSESHENGILRWENDLLEFGLLKNKNKWHWI